MRQLFLALPLALLLTSPTLADSKIALTGSNTKVTFTGTKTDGKHDGGFKTVTGTATVGSDPTTLKLAVDIDVTSLFSDDRKLTGHLLSPDFFNAKKYPKAKFVITKVEKSGSGYKVTGNLTLLGKTKAVTFPAEVSVKGGLKLNSKFKINRTDWGMTFGKGKIDDMVSLAVAVNAK